MKKPRLIIGGAGSGSGKTTVTCAIIKAFAKRGLKVTAGKCGPDFIDPMFHEKILGVSSKNIDLYFQDRNTARALLNEHTKNSDITVIEGVMGYYDGMSFDSSTASTYEVAFETGTPAVLVVNASGMSLTLSAVINGLNDFRENSMIKGIILNNIKAGTYKMLKPVIEKETGLPVVGYLPNNADFVFESRYLGLKLPDEEVLKKIELLGKTAEETIDIDNLLLIAEGSDEIFYEDMNINCGSKVKIAVAMDKAFCFYYKDNIELLEKMDADIIYFSPINDSNLPDDISGIIIGGGYPELYAEKLSANKEMLRQIKYSIESGMPCLAECGGFMYLNKAIDGYDMVGIFDGNVFNAEKLTRFGYISLKSNDSFLDGIKGHEFHYWDTDNNGETCLAVKPSGKRNWKCMRKYKNTLAGFPHLYYYSKPEFAEEFLNKCRGYKA